MTAGMLCAVNARDQVSYRNLDARFPVRVEDATVADWKAMADAMGLAKMGGPAPIISDARR